MESLGGFGFSDMGRTVRKKRSNSSRRPRNDSQPLPDYCDNSSLSSTSPSEDASRISSDDNDGHGTNYWKKELNLNQCSSKASATNLVEGETTLKISNEDAGCRESDGAHIKSNSEWEHSGIDSKRCSEGVLAPANWKSVSKVKGLELQSRTIDAQISRRISDTYSSGPSGQSEVASDGAASDNKVKKVKLKVGGVTRTIHTKSMSVGASLGGSSSMKYSHSSDASRPRKKLILQGSWLGFKDAGWCIIMDSFFEDNSDEDHSSSPEKGSGLQGVPWKHFSRSGFSVKNVNSSRGPKPEESVPIKQSDNHEPVRKSKRIPKRRLLDGAFEDGDDDGELRYLEKLKISKGATHYCAKYEDDVELRNKKVRKISIEAKKSRSGRSSEDTDYVEEEDPLSDGEPETKRKKQRKDLVDVMRDSTREMAITTRKRALQTGKDISSISGASSIEFPNGLPPAPPRKQKDKLSEMEQQLKKAEAAQRRRIQVEKAARESQAEAIRKILGQDSSRKKREDKMKKRQEDLAQERAASAMTLASNTVRWVMGPTGTVVIFPNEMGLPTIFEPKACSYPPPRERCAGPSCTNPYKYRDSKSKLPLCSLQCYKAIHQKLQAVTAC
ncbi:hypothetical protein ACSBR2_003892 [Camellia fascicularis]